MIVFVVSGFISFLYFFFIDDLRKEKKVVCRLGMCFIKRSLEIGG